MIHREYISSQKKIYLKKKFIKDAQNNILSDKLACLFLNKYIVQKCYNFFFFFFQWDAGLNHTGPT